MDSNGNILMVVEPNADKTMEMLRNIETLEMVKRNMVGTLVSLTDEEAEKAKGMTLEERLKVYAEKLVLGQSENMFVEPLTREERLTMNALSIAVYGKSSQWQKMLRKGELRPVTDNTAAGDQISVRRLHHFTVNEIKVTMEKILADREEAAKKSAADRLEREKAQQAKEATDANPNS